MVKSEKIYSPQNYLMAVTNKCYMHDGENDIAFINNRLHENDIDYLWGIPKDFITYSKEFVNKTRETFLVIKGQYANERIGFENDINVRLKIDTKVYNSYTVFIENGMIQVTLYEIPNEEPEFKDLFGDEYKAE